MHSFLPGLAICLMNQRVNEELLSAVGDESPRKVQPLRNVLTNVAFLVGRRLFDQDVDNQVSLLAAVVDSWCAANFWSLEQLAGLAGQRSRRSNTALLRELEDIRLKKAIPPSPRLFQALGAVHAAVCNKLEDGAEIACGELRYAITVTSGPEANQGSWWFAVYCQESWVHETISLPRQPEYPSDLSARLADYLRRQMVACGSDPISDGMAAIKDVFNADPVTLLRLHHWLIGLRDMDSEELHNSIYLLLHVARNFNATPGSVAELLSLFAPNALEA